jgi:signal transduction histidine kinase
MDGNVRYGRTMAHDVVADFLRREAARLADRWEDEVRRALPALRELSRPVLVDHVHEFLRGLADWIDGKTDLADRAFGRLVQGHALQRLGYGVGLETLTREYSKLRVVLLRELLAIPSTPANRESLVRLHEGMDRAINEATRRYATRREEVRERFISILGHDLRDPLSTVVISANTLVDNDQLDTESRQIATRIVRACDRMQRMISDVLDFARGHLGGGIPVHPALADMGEVCRAAADELAAANPQRPIAVRIEGDLRGAFDRDRVHQAIANLLSNAIQHGEGPIELRAYETPDHRAVITEVESHGAVIPARVRDRIFEPFSEADPDAPRQGLGLGLYIVHQIALAHGALSEVESTEQATTFSIRWPRTPGTARRAAAAG